MVPVLTGPRTSKVYSGKPVLIPTDCPAPVAESVVTTNPVPPDPTLRSWDNVVTPVTLTSVTPMPPKTWRVNEGTDVPTPTLLLSASARSRLVLTSRPFLTTKFLLTSH